MKYTQFTFHVKYFEYHMEWNLDNLNILPVCDWYNYIVELLTYKRNLNFVYIAILKINTNVHNTLINEVILFTLLCMFKLINKGIQQLQ